MNEINLEPCPFCGGEAELFHIPENTTEEVLKHPNWRWTYPGMWVVGCHDDECIGNINHYLMIFPTKEMAANAWNRRANIAMDDCIKREDAILALLEKGQHSKRYKLGEIWELNFDEIREAISEVPAANGRYNREPYRRQPK